VAPNLVTTQVPIECDELLHHVGAAPTDGTVLRETPELRAVRESLALPMFASAFVPPEGVWVKTARFKIMQAIRGVWEQGTDFDATEARATWLLSILPNPMEWCGAPDNEMIWTAARQQTALQTGFLMVFVQGPAEKRRRYFAWLDQKLLGPLRETHRASWTGLKAAWEAQPAAGSGRAI